MNYKLVWIDEHLNDKRLKTKEFWTSQDKRIYFYEDECVLNLECEDNLEAIKEAKELSEKFGLEVWSLIKTEVIFTEELL